MENKNMKLIDKLVKPRNRIVLSRIVSVIIIIFWINTKSYWQIHYPVFASLLFMVGVFMLAMGSLGRMWCSLYIAGYKNKKLVTAGPYSMTRNPLYFFSMLGFIGFGFLTKTFLFPMIFLLIFILYYRNVIKKEEKDLLSLFEKEYKEYQKNVPLFIPKLSLFYDLDSYTVKPKIYFNHIKSAIWFIWLIGIVYVIETFQNTGYLSTWSIVF